MKALQYKVISLVAVLALMLVAAPARAADVDGKWSGSFDAGGMPIQIAFTLKADGAKLTGSMTGMDGMEIAIKDGKIDGAKISFLVSIDFGGMPFDLNYTGVVGKEETQMTLDIMGMPINFAVKKAK